MRCKHCGLEIDFRLRSRISGKNLYRSKKPNSKGLYYSCMNKDDHESEEKSNNFKLIYDILNDDNL